MRNFSPLIVQKGIRILEPVRFHHRSPPTNSVKGLKDRSIFNRLPQSISRIDTVLSNSQNPCRCRGLLRYRCLIPALFQSVGAQIQGVLTTLRMYVTPYAVYPIESGNEYGQSRSFDILKVFSQVVIWYICFINVRLGVKRLTVTSI